LLANWGRGQSQVGDGRKWGKKFQRGLGPSLRPLKKKFEKGTGRSEVTFCHLTLGAKKAGVVTKG